MSEIIEGEVVNVVPAAQQVQAMTIGESPYLNMAQIALTNGNVDQLEKIFDLNLKWEANEARKAFVQAMARFKSEPMEILKAKLVTFENSNGDTTSYRHAELSDVTEVVVPAMAKHGLSHRWAVIQESGQVEVTCTVTHQDGHSESVTLKAAPDSSGKKNAIQQVASTVTYLQRYTLLAATGMATTGMDDDAQGAYKATVEYITEEQQAELQDLLDETKSDKKKFLDWLKVEKLDQIPAAHFKTAKDALNEVGKKKAAK